MSNRKQIIGIAVSGVIAIILLVLIWFPDSGSQLEESSVVATENETMESDTEMVPNSDVSSFQIEDTVNTNQFEFTITNAYVLDDLGEEKKVPEGAVYVVLEYEYKNISQNPIGSLDLPVVWLVDRNGASYSQDADAKWYLDVYRDSKVISDLNPGIKTKDAGIFEVSIDVLNMGEMKVKVQADQEFLIDLPLSYDAVADQNDDEEYLGNAKSDDYSEWQDIEGDYGDGYILEDSVGRFLTVEKLSSLSKEELRLARNEIYARHGRLFQAEDLQDYFYSMDWYYGYIPSDQFDESVLNEYEKSNLITIKEVEAMK